MIVGLMIVSLLGSMLTATLVGFSQHSLLVALLSAPFGGSLFVVMVALLHAAHAQPRGVYTLSRRERLEAPPGVVWS